MATLTSPMTIEGPYNLAAGDSLTFHDSNAFELPEDKSADAVDILGVLNVTGDGANSVTAFDVLEGLALVGGTLKLEQTATVSVTNSGSGDAYGYHSTSFGPQITNDTNFTVSNTGSGSAYGIFDQDSRTPTTNYGKLDVSAASGAARAIYRASGGDVVNTGLISAQSANGDAIAIDAEGASSINSSGTIRAIATAPGHSSVGVEFDAVNGTLLLTNYGSISASTAVEVNPNLNQHPNLTVYNINTMSGDIRTGQGTFYLQNTGTLTGNVYLGSYPGTVDFSKGTFNGEVYIDPSHSIYALNDVITLGGGGVVDLGGGDANVHITLNGSTKAGVATTLHMAGSIKDATFTNNADGSELVSSTTSGSATLNNVTAVQFSDGTIPVAGASIVQEYDLFMGRQPTTDEIAYWQGRLASGAHVQDIGAAIIADPTGKAYTDSQVTAQYETYFGRAPTGGELRVWEGLLSGGDSYADLRSALVASPESSVFIAGQIKAEYDAYMGRDPAPSEVSYWQAHIVAGGSLGDARTAILQSGFGMIHTNTTVTSLYDTYMGRDPTAGEAQTWRDLILGGDSFADTRGAILSSADGQAHTAATVTTLYDTYFGRDPGAPELNVWQGLIGGGSDFGTVRAALLADPAGVAHTQAQVTSMYNTYFGRDPTSSEVGVWQGLITGGDDYLVLQDTLERQSTASSVSHAVAYGSVRTFSLDAAPNLTIENYAADYDTINLSAAKFGGINPLDAAHAHPIAALDGTFDVLITLDATHSILLEHTFMNSLHPSDFVFT